MTNKITHSIEQVIGNIWDEVIANVNNELHLTTKYYQETKRQTTEIGAIVNLEIRKLNPELYNDY